MRKKFKYSKLFYFIKYTLFFKISIIYIRYRERKYTTSKIQIVEEITDISSKQTIINQKISNLQKIFSRKITSGGTTGTPTTFYEYYWTYFLETFYINSIFNQAGWNPSKKTIVFRGDKIEGSYQIFGNMLVISSYKMLDNIEEIEKKISQFNPTWVYAYPSVFYTFYKKSSIIKKIPLEGILFGSEKLLDNQKLELLHNYSNSTITEWYGMSEKALLGFRISPSKYFNFFKSYADVYLLANQNLFSIYGTSHIQYPTEINKYDTGDFAKLDEENNIIEIIGRKQDFLYLDNKKIPFSQAIGSIHGEVWTNILQWQIIQNQKDEIIFKIKTIDKQLFSYTTQEMDRCLTDFIRNGLSIQYMEIEEEPELRTIAGKAKYFIQNIS